MKELTIDPEFRDKVPPLTEDEFKQLEENIVAEGRVMVPIVTWNGTIIDGHNRYAIIQKHPKIPFDVTERDFPDRYAAIVWICKNQLGRRNLTEQDKSYLRGKQYEAEKMTQGAFHGNQHVSASGQNVHHQKKREIRDGTAVRIGKEYGVGERTIRRDAEYAKGVDAIEKDSPGMKHKILSGKVKAAKEDIANYLNLENEKKSEMLEGLKNGTAQNKAKPFGGGGGNTKENRAITSATKMAAEDLYNTEREVSYTQDDLKEEMDWIVNDYIKKARNALTIRSTVLNEPGAKEKIAAVLLVAETATKEMRGLLL